MRRRQTGYLLEVPIVLMLLLVGVALLMPRLPPVGRKVLATAAVAPILVLLYVMIVGPGWQPGISGVRARYGRLGAFLLLAAAVAAGLIRVLRG